MVVVRPLPCPLNELIPGQKMPNENLKKLYVDELKDLFSAESQLLKALPKGLLKNNFTDLVGSYSSIAGVLYRE